MSDKTRHILIRGLVLVFCVAALLFGKSLWEYHKGAEIYESALEFVAEEEVLPSTEEEEEKAEEPEEKKKPQAAPVSKVFRTNGAIDFAGLQAINPDIIGWIQIQGTQVDYPLLDADDNSYYLKRTYDLRRSAYGSIFLDPRNRADLSNYHLIIYGHNMINSSMFGSLLNYKNQGYADLHNTITICLPGKDLKYRVFSAYTAHVDSPTYRIAYSSETEFQEIINHMKENSVIRSDVTPEIGDQILTLSTCTPAGAKEYRFVVNAVLVTGNKPAAPQKKLETISEEVLAPAEEDNMVSDVMELPETDMIPEEETILAETMEDVAAEEELPEPENEE